MPRSDSTLDTPKAEKLREAAASFAKSDAKLEAELTGERTTLDQHKSSLIELQSRVIDPPTLENASAIEIAVKATERLISQGGTRIRALVKKREALAAKYKSQCEGIGAGDALAFGEKQNAATTAAAQGKIAEIDLLAAAFAADLDCPVGIEPRPSRQINAALDAIVREHFAGHIDWLRFETAAAKLRDLLTREPRAAAAKAHKEAITTIKSRTPLAPNFEYDAQAELGHLVLPGSAEHAEVKARAAAAAAAFRKLHFGDPIAAVEAEYTATIAELDSLPLDTLVERYAAAAKEQLEIEADAAAAKARAIEPNEVEIRAASGLLPVDSRSAEQCRQLAQTLAGQKAHDAVTGTCTAPAFVIPERPACDRPANLEHYKELLAPYLAPAPEMPSQIQLDCQADIIRKYGTASLSTGAAA